MIDAIPFIDGMAFYLGACWFYVVLQWAQAASIEYSIPTKTGGYLGAAEKRIKTPK